MKNGRKMKRNIAWLLFTLCVAGSGLQAQQPLTLEECRNLAIQHNKELQMSGEKIKAAANERKEAATKYFPQVSAGGAYLRNQKNIKLVDWDIFGAAGQLIPSKIQDFFELDIHNVWVGNVSLVQPLFTGGKIIAYNQITEYARQLAETMKDTKLQDVIYSTDQTYWQVISLVNKKRLADSYVALLRKTNRDMEIMIEEGVATKADGLSVRVKLNEAEVAQTKVDNGLSLTRMLLAQICGLPVDSEMRLSDENIETLPVHPEEIASVNVNEALANRDELKSLDYAVKIYEKQETIALSDMLPNVAFTANYLVTNPHAYDGFKNKFGGMWNVGFVLKVPVTDWIGGSFKRNAARAQTNIKRLEWLDAREKIELQVNQSVYKVNEASKKLTASVRNMESAEENLRYAHVGFEEGVIPALNLMEAQTAWVSASSELIDAQIDVKLSQVYLTKALGKLPVPEQTDNNKNNTYDERK